MQTSVRASGFGLALAVAAGAHAGVVMHEVRRSADYKEKPSAVWYIQEGMARIDRLDDQGHVTDMILFRDGAAWDVDVAQRTFSKIDQAAMQQRMQGAEAQMQAMLATLPPDKRAAMEQRMQAARQSAGNAKYSWTSTSRTESAGNVSCQIWILSRNDKPTKEVCVAAPSAIPGGSEVRAALEEMAAKMQEVMAGVPQLARSVDYFTGIKQYQGIPVLTREGSTGHFHDERVFTTIERQALPSDKFQIPKGFTEKPWGQKGGGGE